MKIKLLFLMTVTLFTWMDAIACGVGCTKPNGIQSTEANASFSGDGNWFAILCCVIPLLLCCGLPLFLFGYKKIFKKDF